MDRTRLARLATTGCLVLVLSSCVTSGERADPHRTPTAPSPVRASQPVANGTDPNNTARTAPSISQADAVKVVSTLYSTVREGFRKNDARVFPRVETGPALDIDASAVRRVLAAGPTMHMEYTPNRVTDVQVYVPDPPPSGDRFFLASAVEHYQRADGIIYSIFRQSGGRGPWLRVVKTVGWTALGARIPRVLPLTGTRLGTAPSNQEICRQYAAYELHASVDESAWDSVVRKDRAETERTIATHQLGDPRVSVTVNPGSFGPGWVLPDGRTLTLCVTNATVQVTPKKTGPGYFILAPEQRYEQIYGRSTRWTYSRNTSVTIALFTTSAEPTGSPRYQTVAETAYALDFTGHPYP